jgi:hypothetical protein
MIMIGRMTIGMAEIMETIVYLLQHIEQHPTILSVFKNRPLSLPCGGDMIQSLSRLNPHRSHHALLLRPPTTNVNIDKDRIVSIRWMNCKDLIPSPTFL